MANQTRPHVRPEYPRLDGQPNLQEEQDAEQTGQRRSKHFGRTWRPWRAARRDERQWAPGRCHRRGAERNRTLAKQPWVCLDGSGQAEGNRQQGWKGGACQGHRARIRLERSARSRPQGRRGRESEPRAHGRDRTSRRRSSWSFPLAAPASRPTLAASDALSWLVPEYACRRQRWFGRGPSGGDRQSERWRQREHAGHAGR